jgi:putative ABC transport system permease protein
MIFKYTFKTALNGLRTNKSRSALTILGIVIGVASIIAIESIGEGAQLLIVRQLEGLGSQTIVIQPGREPKGLSDFASLFLDSLKEKDLLALKNKNNVPTLLDLSPEIIVPGSVTYLGESKDALTIGTSPAMTQILDLYPTEGVFFSDEDVANYSYVAVIGSKVKEKFFGDGDVLNQKIKIRNRNFRVVGVFSSAGQAMMFDVDSLVIIPYTTAQRYLLGTDHYTEIVARAVSKETVDQTARDIVATLREAHGITDPAKDDFHIQTQEDIQQRAGMITDILKMLLMSVAAISLLVGGIGIMNIMLVSVTERTREIGLRKAIGARSKDILWQFLVEAVLLTLTGGGLGVMLGAGISFMAALVLSRLVAIGWVFTFPLSAALVGLAVAFLVGLVFGIYPARKAAKKDPIEALRYE